MRRWRRVPALGVVVHGIAILVRTVGRTAILTTLKDPREDAHRASDRDHISGIARQIKVSESCTLADVFLRRQCLHGTPTKESCVRASGVSTLRFISCDETSSRSEKLHARTTAIHTRCARSGHRTLLRHCVGSSRELPWPPLTLSHTLTALPLGALPRGRFTPSGAVSARAGLTDAANSRGV